MTLSRRRALAARITSELRRHEGRNLVAVGVYGSVARETERSHSDVDLLVVVRKKRSSLRIHMRDGLLVTILQYTPLEAREEVQGADSDLNASLGGWQSMRPLYDPSRLLARLRARSFRPTLRQFQMAARRALLETYEDLGKLRNAVVAGNSDEAREMAIWYTSGAMGALFDLEGHVLPTGRRAFIEVKRRGKLGRAIRSLRYEGHSLEETSRLSEGIWSDLLRRAHRCGVEVEGLT
jgi:kanamycin nucleotidyltransferase